MAGMEPDEMARLRKRIERELAELEALQQATAGNAGPVALDQQSVGRLSRMDAMQGQAIAAASDRRRTGTIARLRRTLARMDEGEFGYCAECGEPIARGRLEADPSTPFCVSCAAMRD